MDPIYPSSILTGGAAALRKGPAAGSAGQPFAGGGASPEGRPWAARMHRRDSDALWDLRLLAGIEAGLAGDYIWLRGSAWSDAIAVTLGRIPSAMWYEVQQGGRLREFPKLLPTGRLPVVAWQALGSALRLSPPATALPGHAPLSGDAGLVPLRLERSPVEHGANLLIVDEAPWREFIESAPEVRFSSLYFAVSGDGRVCVGHAPELSVSARPSGFSSRSSGGAVAVLPSLQGARFWSQEGVAVPCGWNWVPALPVGIVRMALWSQRESARSGSPPPLPFGPAPEISSSSSLSASSSAAERHPLAPYGWLYLWPAEGSSQWISGEQILPLSRSAARLSYTRG